MFISKIISMACAGNPYASKGCRSIFFNKNIINKNIKNVRYFIFVKNIPHIIEKMLITIPVLKKARLIAYNILSM